MCIINMKFVDNNIKMCVWLREKVTSMGIDLNQSVNYWQQEERS